MRTKALLALVSITATLMPTTIALAILSPDSPVALTKLINKTASKQLGTGYTRPKNPIIGQAQEGGVFSKSFSLKANKNYAFIAVCGKPNCVDVDLVVLDSKGKELVADQTDNSEAVVKYKPTKAGVYKVNVEMYACNNTSACALGLGAYRQ